MLRLASAPTENGERQHWRALDGDGRILTSAKIRTPGGLLYHNRRVGTIGDYEASDRAAGREILVHACRKLAELGCGIAIGPMKGSTWEAYRLVTDVGTEDSFFMEPTNPSEHVDDFRNAGFEEVERYVSRIVSDLQNQEAKREPRARGAATLENLGGHVHSIEMKDYERTLKRMHGVALDAFAGNALYTPIPQERFIAMYEGIRRLIDPDLCLLYEKNDELIGFVFAVANHAQKERGERVDTAIVKTMARRPGQQWRGVGGVLSHAIRDRMQKLGYERAIHALMHEENASAAMSARSSTIMRRYALFGRGIG